MQQQGLITDSLFLDGHSASWPRIALEPVPYRADGAISLGSGLQLIGLLGLLGMLLGALAALIGLFYYMIVIMPLLMGGCIGFAGSKCIKRFHVRNPLICGIAGLFAGCVAMFTMHSVEFRIFEYRLAADLGEDGRAAQQIALHLDDVRAHLDQATPWERQVVNDLEKDPELLRTLQATNIWRHLDLSAHRGVEIQGNGGQPINLGYYGSYMYWLFEVILVAGLAFGMTRGTANEPYCSECNTWKMPRQFGPFADARNVADNVRQGTLMKFSPMSEDAQASGVVTLFTCPRCGNQSSIDVRVEKLTVNRKGQVKKKKLTQMTYPGETLVVLETICMADLPMATPPADSIRSPSDGSSPACPSRPV